VFKAFDMLAVEPEKITKEIMQGSLDILKQLKFLPSFKSGVDNNTYVPESINKYTNLDTVL